MIRGANLSAPKASGRIGMLALVGLVAIVLLGFTFTAWRSIRPGYVGIVFDKASHQVTASALEPGWAFINPFTQAIQEYPITIQTYEMVQKSSEGVVSGDDSIKIQSSEGQQLNLDVVIQYQVKRNEAGALYQDWGGADIGIVEDRVVRQYTRSQVPVIAARYTWEDIVSGKRAELVDLIGTGLRGEFARRHLELVSFGIREVHLPEALQQALNNKIQAQQQAEQQRYQLEQARVQAEQAKVEAEGKAGALLVQAEAQANANRQLAASITDALIRYQQIQKWDGKLPVFTGGATPLIDASNIVSGTATQP